MTTIITNLLRQIRIALFGPRSVAAIHAQAHGIVEELRENAKFNSAVADELFASASSRRSEADRAERCANKWADLLS